MTFDKALNSKKWFKRPKHEQWLWVDPKDGVIYWENGNPAYFTKESLNALDWKVKKIETER